MTEPLHHLGYAFHPRPVRQRRSLDHDDRKLQFACGIDLGACAVSPGVAGDDPLDPPRTHQVQFACEREWSTRDDKTCIRQRQRTSRGIDEAERVGMLRPRHERRNVLPADGEENIRPRLRQGSHGGCDVLHLDPDIVRCFRPRLPLQRNQRRCRCRAGSHRVAADLGCEGMGRIDHMREPFLPDGIGKTIRAAEAANAGRQRLIDRHLRSSGIGIDRVEPRSRDGGRQQVGFTRSAQNEDAHG